MNLRKIFLYLLIISVAVSALLGIVVIIFGSFGEFATRVLMTTFTITLTSILGLACGAYLELRGAKTLPYAGIFSSLVAAALAIFMIWFDENNVAAIWKTGATAAILATACGHLSLISIATLDKRFLWSRYVIYSSVAILVSIFLWILWLEPESSSDIVSRIIGVLSIVVAALTVITPVFHKLSHKETGTSEIDAEIDRLRARIAELEAKRAELV